MAKKLTKVEQYEKEYLDQLAFSLVQFWPVTEELPDEEARESEVYYRVAIRRLRPEQRVELVKRLRRMTTRVSGVFVPEQRGTAEVRQLVLGIIARFPQLLEAAQMQAGLTLAEEAA